MSAGCKNSKIAEADAWQKQSKTTNETHNFFSTKNKNIKQNEIGELFEQYLKRNKTSFFFTASRNHPEASMLTANIHIWMAKRKVTLDFYRIDKKNPSLDIIIFFTFVCNQQAKRVNSRFLFFSQFKCVSFLSITGALSSSIDVIFLLAFWILWNEKYSMLSLALAFEMKFDGKEKERKITWNDSLYLFSKLNQSINVFFYLSRLGKFIRSKIQSIFLYK